MQKIYICMVVVVVCKPILVFSLAQAEQKGEIRCPINQKHFTSVHQLLSGYVFLTRLCPAHYRHNMCCTTHMYIIVYMEYGKYIEDDAFMLFF